MRLWWILAATDGMLAVIAGAIGDHLVKGRVSTQQLQWFNLANRYQLWHAPALLAVALIIPHIPSSRGRAVANGDQ